MWHVVGSIDDVPADRDLCLAVIDGAGTHELAFPCRRVEGSWVDAKTGRPVDVSPTHWQEWSQK